MKTGGALATKKGEPFNGTVETTDHCWRFYLSQMESVEDNIV